MELWFSPHSMPETLPQNSASQAISPKEGFLPIKILAEKYGYAKDYVGWLSRTGRIEAIRHGKYGQLYASEASLQNYRQTLVESRGKISQHMERESNAQPVSELGQRDVSQRLATSAQGRPVLSKNEGSLSAVNNPVLSVRRTPTAKFPLAMGGFLFFLLPPPFLEKAGLMLSENLNNGNASIVSTLRNPIVSFFDFFKAPEPEIQDYLVPVPTLNRNALSVVPSPSPKPVPEKTEQRDTESLNEKAISGLGRIVSASTTNLTDLPSDSPTLESRFASLAVPFSEFQRTTPTIHYLPSTNINGIGPITLNPENIRSETLTVTGASSLSGTLAVSDDFSVDTSVFKVDTLNNRVGINVSSPEVAFEVIGDASVSGAFTVGGQLNVLGNIGIGTTIAPNQLTVIGSGSFTGQLKATRNPSQAHTGTWPSFTNASDATVYINPDSPVADGNVLVYANDGATKFVVDAEGDIYGNSLILSGTTTQGTTQVTADLTVEGNTQLGDAVGDKIKFVGSIQPFSLTSNILSVQASPSWSGDYYFRSLDSSSNPVFVVASTSYVGIGKAIPLTTLDVSGNASVSGNFEISGRFNADTLASHSFTGDLTISKEFVSSGTASNSFAGSLLVSKGFNAQSIVGTGLTINGNHTLTGTFTGQSTASNSFAGSLDITKGLNLTGNLTNGAVTASRLISTNGSKVLSSVSSLTSWIAGTANQVTVTDDGDGSITLSLPQDIHTGARPTFGSILVNGRGEFQGTASASYGLFGSLPIAGFSSASYSRFGTATTTHSSDLSTPSDLLISGDLEIDGSFFADSAASISGNFQTEGRFIFGDGGDTGALNTSDWDISDTGVLTGISGITTNGGYTQSGTDFNTLTGKLFGINAEFQGTASASYGLFGSLQVGGFSSASYSRFGTDTTGYSADLDAANDLLISGDLEIDGSFF